METIRNLTYIVFVTVLLWQFEKSHDHKGEVSILDGNFLEALINEGVDINNDGQISYSEAGKVNYLFIFGDIYLMYPGNCAERMEMF